MKFLRKWKKKNQLLIALLTLLIAAAGYINYSGFEFGMTQTVSHKASKKESSKSKEEENLSAKVDDETPVGEAVLTAAEVSNYVAQAKLTREQTHEKAKENLEAVISNKNLDDSQKKEASNQLALLSSNLEKEVQAEELLGAKGFLNSVVSISENSTDVIVQKKALSKVEKAQIEDIVTRKTGCEVNQIVITSMQTDD